MGKSKKERSNSKNAEEKKSNIGEGLFEMEFKPMKFICGEATYNGKVVQNNPEFHKERQNKKGQLRIAFEMLYCCGN